MYAFFFSPIFITRPACHVYFVLIIAIIFGEQYKLWRSSSCSSLKTSCQLSLFSPNIPHSTLFSNTSALCKVKPFPSVSSRGGLQVCEILRIPHCLDNRLTDGGKVVTLRTGRSLLPRNNFSASGTHFCYSKPQGLVRPEGLGKLKKFIRFIGSRTSSGL
jgi:hypothetical protein